MRLRGGEYRVSGPQVFVGGKMGGRERWEDGHTERLSLNHAI